MKIAKNNSLIIFPIIIVLLVSGCTQKPKLEGLEKITFIRNESSLNFYSEATYNKDGSATYFENKNGSILQKTASIREKEFSELSELLAKANFLELEEMYYSEETKGLDSFAIKALINGKEKSVTLFSTGPESLIRLTKLSYILATEKFGASPYPGGQTEAEIRPEFGSPVFKECLAKYNLSPEDELPQPVFEECLSKTINKTLVGGRG